MMRKLSQDVAECYARAEDCQRKAEQAFTADTQQDFLRLQQSWLNLARSYEFAERPLAFSKENNRRRVEIYGDEPNHY